MLGFLVVSIVRSFVAFFSHNLQIRIFNTNGRALHQNLFNSFVDTDMIWLGNCPASDIDYKLSYDLKTVDLSISKRSHLMLESLAHVICGILVLNFVDYGIMFGASLFFLVFYRYYSKKYLRTARWLIKFIENSSSSV